MSMTIGMTWTEGHPWKIFLNIKKKFEIFQICQLESWDNLYDLDNVHDNVTDNLYDLNNVHDNLYDLDNVSDNLYDLANVSDNLYDLNNVHHNLYDLYNVSDRGVKKAQSCPAPPYLSVKFHTSFFEQDLP